MRLDRRVRRLEREAAGRGCAACVGRTIAVVYDPPHPEGKPVMIGGIACPPAECAECGRTPGLVVTMRPPEGPEGMCGG